jgi:hypothetical protein
MTTHPGERSGSVYLLHFEPGLPVTGNRVAVTTSASPSATSRDAWRSTCDGRDRPWSRPSSRRAAASRSSACGRMSTAGSSDGSSAATRLRGCARGARVTA